MTNLFLQLSSLNSSSLNKEGDLTAVKVEKERVNAEKAGLDLILKQKDSEIESFTKCYEELTEKMKTLTQERNSYKIKLDDIESESKVKDFNHSRLKNQIEQIRDQYEKSIIDLDQKEASIRDLKSSLSEEKRARSFEIEESRKENLDLQKQSDRLENEVDEKTEQVRNMIAEIEEKSKESADIEQNLRNELITQGTRFILHMINYTILE